jgi:lipoprotein-anchoring transpeptidase ErfK/SrfK
VSGRLWRPLAVLTATLALAAPLPLAARAGVAPIRASQQIVVLLRSHEARSAASGRSAPLGLVPATTPITGGPTTLPVLAQHGAWLKVRLPGRPNGHTGWVNRAATRRTATAWHIVVDRGRRLVTVFRAGRPVRAFSAVVGKPSTPTPGGQFFVEESIALRAADVGAPFALALSARSNILQEFDGGPGQIALHGLDNVGGVLGTAASHGCVRLADSTMRWLVARIAPGTPVTILG